MQLDAFMLADAAATFEGKLYIHGGGFTRINAPAIPWVQPQLSIVIRLQVEDDWKPDNELGLRLFDPDGASVLPPIVIPLPSEPPPAVPAGEEAYIQMVLGLGPIQFAQEGVYRFEVKLGEDVLRSMRFPVVALSVEDLPEPG